MQYKTLFLFLASYFVANNLSAEEYDDAEVLKAFNLSLPELLKVTVTAQKEEQSIQEVPIAVSNIWADQLEQLRIADAINLSFHVPGFSAGQFNIAQPQFYIRGIGSNEDGAGGDNAVIVTVDGVPVSRAAGSLFNFYDVERIEVLRGPQGTLYGRNATGGAINVISNLPSEEKLNIVNFALTTDGGYQTNAYFNGALDDDEDYLSSVSIFHKKRDGIVNSIYGPELSDINDSGIKAQLYSTSSATSTWRLIAEYSEDRRAGPGRFANGGLIAAAIEATHDTINTDPFLSYSPFNGYQNRDSTSFTLITKSDLSWAGFSSTTGYRKNNIQSQIDQGGVSEQEELIIDVLGVGLSGTNDVDENSWQFTQEFQLNKKMNDWKWISGLFYLHENTDRTEIFDYLLDSFSYQDNTTNSLALFGELTFDINEKISLITGGRFSYEKKSIEQSGVAGLLIVSQDYAIEAEKSWRKLNPRLVLNYSANKDFNSYLSISSGFKSGGFQGSAPNELAAKKPFNEENVLSYELGLKWYSAEYQARFHAALYRMNYDDLQVLQLVNNPDDPTGVGSIVTENAADAVSQGIELEWEKLLAQHWLLFGSYSYQDATYKHYSSIEGDFAGKNLRNAPKNSASIAISYQTKLSDQSDLNITYSQSYQDIRYQDPANITNTAIPSVNLANLHVNFKPNDSSWTLKCWIDNVWNETYYIHGFPLLASGMLTPAPKRTLGLNIQYQF